ncbi:hypothetical protein CEXT_378861 [Caerostris extrusa]|uniref:Uncharacterized protein n=1 Tax=Caerostris extrusa TaxID=172846 RepID=A0AAV4WSI4_CAEEX|nr:hypothetical protein CEXT_378861 [Caerostris extrusa]
MSYSRAQEASQAARVTVKTSHLFPQIESGCRRWETAQSTQHSSEQQSQRGGDWVPANIFQPITQVAHGDNAAPLF